MDCVFCRIVAGTQEASIVYQDDSILALCDLHPVNPGHLLVITRAHATGLTDLDEETGRHMFTLGQRLATALRRTDLRCEGVNLFLADGAAALQEVFHAHLHVIPRYVGDRFRLNSGQSTSPTPRCDLDTVAGKVRTALANVFALGGVGEGPGGSVTGAEAATLLEGGPVRDDQHGALATQIADGRSSHRQ